MKLTVDASVVVKWFVPESLSEESRLLLVPHLELHAPDVLPAEFANTIWKKVRLNELQDARPYVDELLHLSEIVRLYPAHTLVARAARIAQDLDRPIYDCLYLACAETTESVLVTADRRFADGILNVPGCKALYLGEDGFADEIEVATTAPKR